MKDMGPVVKWIMGIISAIIVSVVTMGAAAIKDNSVDIGSLKSKNELMLQQLDRIEHKVDGLYSIRRGH